MTHALRILPVLLTFTVGCSLFESDKAGSSPDGGLDAKTGGEAGAGGEAGTDQDGALPPGSPAFFNELKVFKSGGTIPASGMQGAITVTVNSDGSRTISMAGANGTKRLLIDWQSYQAYTLTADIDGNGTVDEQMTATTADDVTTTVWELDNDLSGAFNFRATMTDGPAGKGATVEQVLFGATTFTQTSSYAGSFAAANCTALNLDPAMNGAGLECDPSGGSNSQPSKPTYCGMPPATGTPAATKCDPFHLDGQTKGWTAKQLAPQVVNGAPFYVIEAGPMACDATQYTTIWQALSQATRDFPTIANLNPTFADVYAGLSDLAGLYYGCESPSCLTSQVAVTTDAKFANKDYSIITTINPSIIALGQDALEEIILHEWFHRLYGHIPDDTGGNERDFIYSCSRVANGGRAWNAGMYLGVCCDASSARDHAMCAETPQKAQYGIQNIFLETADGVIEEPNSGFTGATDMKAPTQVCTDPPSSATSPCSCFLERAAAYCDQAIVTEADALKLGVITGAETLRDVNCCEICPGATPYSSAVAACGTATPGTEQYCPPPTVCPTALPKGTYAVGPTPLWRQAASAIAVGQATGDDPTAMASTVCPKVSGFPY